jgi:hypothetical protein
VLFFSKITFSSLSFVIWVSISFWASSKVEQRKRTWLMSYLPCLVGEVDGVSPSFVLGGSTLLYDWKMFGSGAVKFSTFFVHELFLCSNYSLMVVEFSASSFFSSAIYSFNDLFSMRTT